MTAVRISVIVPVYNAEKYVRDCLDSIRRQTFSKFEVICIDDGSTDSSWEILLEYAEKDSRFQVLRTENRGVGAARNKGVQRARGEYISFLDSDDFVHPQFLEIMLTNLLSRGVEVTSCGYERVPESATYASLNVTPPSQSGLTVYDSFFQALIKNKKGIRVVVWNKLYRSTLVKKCPFNEDLKAHEDDLFMLHVASCTDRILHTTAELIFYRDTPKSLSKHDSPKWRQKFMDNWLQSVQQIKSLSPTDSKVLKKRTMRLVYREIVKRPFRQEHSDSVAVLMESRNKLLEIRNRGQFAEQYLPLQDQFVCKLLLAGYCKMVNYLLTTALFNWRMHLNKREVTGPQKV